MTDFIPGFTTCFVYGGGAYFECKKCAWTKVQPDDWTLIPGISPNLTHECVTSENDA